MSIGEHVDQLEGLYEQALRREESAQA